MPKMRFKRVTSFTCFFFVVGIFTAKNKEIAMKFFMRFVYMFFITYIPVFKIA